MRHGKARLKSRKSRVKDLKTEERPRVAEREKDDPGTLSDLDDSISLSLL